MYVRIQQLQCAVEIAVFFAHAPTMIAVSSSKQYLSSPNKGRDLRTRYDYGSALNKIISSRQVQAYENRHRQLPNW
jgi:hypothetical protein